MTDYTAMSIDQLVEYRDLWPAQQSEWNRANLILQKRLAVKHAYLDLAEELRDDGLRLTRAIAPVAAGTIWEEMSDAEVIAGTAYQLVGNLMTPEQFDSPEGQRVLDWFADYDDDKGVMEDLLPVALRCPISEAAQ
jgi:hypothetical protein